MVRVAAALALCAAVGGAPAAEPPDSAVSTAALHDGWHRYGIALRDAGDVEGAIAAQRRSAFHGPYLPHAWRHLGNALMRGSVALLDVHAGLACGLAVESRDALSLADVHLGDAHAPKGLAVLARDVFPRLPRDCAGAAAAALDAAEGRAVAALAALDAARAPAPDAVARAAAAAVDAYCADLDGMHVAAPDHSALSPTVARRAYAALRLCGVAGCAEFNHWFGWS
ncbi:hypothetical protein AURANDRAFT_65872 [Aureococcus anophagefferens]|uniref:Uncharacterized protein n=1 Tax=Aureococcus anophagefferens TaxID=44056 RepID=F0YFA1_AURAN|nr:hypothetical protein AURANDRAFT_65872 [Aureococcus anophagefferens]EGB06155.1 hypothetical protein AURANDRAFT_65872 [Aureococcus anophagefferens]|eukprot:XP_009039109.1 hypothetical protein AURANDRAFT_65872 [Aureococcus anophagefferens]